MKISAPDTPRPARRRRWLRWLAAALWAALMLPLAPWGLPTARLDPLLFGDESPWPPERYGAAERLAALREPSRGADTDVDPLRRSADLIDLTPDNAARGAILQRFRLQSRQPDEMITFRSLQNMNPRALDFDPRLYQYGGAYIALVGVLLAVVSTVGLLTITADVNHYLAHPDDFGAFFIAARCLSIAFGALTLVGLARLASRAAGRRAGWLAMLVAATCPVFITMSLEAKPHLPSACLLVWATVAALQFLDRGRARDALRLGVLGGLAAGFVLTGFAAALLWPALLLAGRGAAQPRFVRRAVGSGAIALVVYALTNPYVIRNAFAGGALQSNLGNSLSMYRIHDPLGGAANVLDLLLEGGGAALMLVGLLGCGLVWIRFGRRALPAALCAVGLVVLLSLIGAGKPAEFGRFLLFPVLLLAAGAAVFVAWLTSTLPARTTALAALLLCVANLPGTFTYIAAFWTDARESHEPRRLAAAFLREAAPIDDALGVLDEPAPHWTPPVDFAHRPIVLLPREAPADPPDPARLPNWVAAVGDDENEFSAAWWVAHYRLVRRFDAPGLGSARIAWAGKPTFVFVRRVSTR